MTARSPQPNSTMNTQLDIARKAVVYGLPLVLMDLTRKRMTNVAKAGFAAAPLNQFAHAPAFPPANFRTIVRANVDTLYSSAFLDLAAEPVVMSVPQTEGRYYLLPIMDAWTNVFASPGTRTTGSQPGTFAITGPDWNGTLPDGMEELKSPTNMAWILGRTQTNGPDDYAAVHAVQSGYSLVPLSQFGRPFTAPAGSVDNHADMRTPPVEQLLAMTAADFFSTLARLLHQNPPSAADAPLLAELAGIGLVAGQPFDVTKIQGMESVVQDAIAGLQKEAPKFIGASVNGWRIPKMNTGAFGTDYEARAFIALIALGANLPQDALYPTAFVDGDGRDLNGANRYVLHFEPGLTPPVNTFWSVTLYDSASFFVENAIERQAISSWMPLTYNEDGSLDLYVQHDAPAAERLANWLPAPEGDFNLTMRMYWPKDQSPSILDGSWAPPAVTMI